MNSTNGPRWPSWWDAGGPEAGWALQEDGSPDADGSLFEELEDEYPDEFGEIKEAGKVIPSFMAGQNILVLEGLIVRFGAGELSRDEYRATLAGSHRLTKGRAPYPWVHDVLAERAPRDADAVLWHYCRAVCAQIQIMRGSWQDER